MVWSKNVSSSTCIYSAFQCLCLSAIPMKMSYISLFLLLPGWLCRGWAALFIDLTWHDRDTQEDTRWSTHCHVNMHWRRTRWGEDRGIWKALGKQLYLLLLEKSMLFQNGKYRMYTEHAANSKAHRQDSRSIHSQCGVVWSVGCRCPLSPPVVECKQLFEL